MFLRLALQRLGDGEFLVNGARYNAAVYLTGYAIECGLKALILSALSSTTQQNEMMATFRGNIAHNYDWLKSQYEELTRSKSKRVAVKFPREILESLLRVNSWDTDLRYQTALIEGRVALAFQKDAERIVGWIERSLS